jgi:uncharacterized membrane protein/protein-disulfide isomerase
MAGSASRPSSAGRALLAIRLLALAGVAVSAYLLGLAIARVSPAGCGGDGGGCDTVLGGRWARLGGVPVAGIAVGVHAGLLLVSLGAGSAAPAGRRRVAWAVMVLLASAAAGAAAWFAYLQVRVIGRICPVCMVDHAVGVAVWAAVLWGVVGRRPAPVLASRVVGGLALAGLATAAGFAAVQVRFPGAAADPTGVPTDAAGALRLLEALPVGRFPFLGPAGAPRAIYVLSDYTCPRCRELHVWLGLARERYGAGVRVVVVPVALNSACNRGVTRDQPLHRDACAIARLALAAWRAGPGAYAGVEDALFGPPEPPSPPAARERLARLVGVDALRRAEGDPEVERDLARGADLYVALGGGRLPKIILGDSLVDGLPPSPERLFKWIEQHLGVRPR